jgi:hypothetical protein
MKQKNIRRKKEDALEMREGSKIKIRLKRRKCWMER